MKTRYSVTGAVVLISAVWLLPGVPAVAEESGVNVSGALDSTTLSGYVDTAVTWNPGPGPTAVPEPSAVALAVLGGVLLLGGRRWFRR